MLEAIARVLCQKRREAPGQENNWILKVDKRRDAGPVGQIIQVRRSGVAAPAYDEVSNTRNSG